MKYFIITIIVVCIDQISKLSIKYYWYNNDIFYSHINILGSYLRFTFLENPGIAFGIDTSKYHLFITFLTIFVILFLFKYFFQVLNENSFEILPLSLILGGAIGNAIDRVLVLFPSLNYNGVVDFIDIGINKYRWYVFNFADAFITIGLVIYLYKSFRFNKQ